MHQLLRWANKREVARELTRRGFDVSGETLNRWVREQRETPQILERLVLDMYGLDEHDETPTPGVPEWAKELMTRDEVLALVDRVQSAVTTEITTTRETVVAALAREVTRRALEGNETLLTRIHDVLARVENRLAE